MREMNSYEVEEVVGGWAPWVYITAAVFIYDATTDFFKGFEDGVNEANAK